MNMSRIFVSYCEDDCIKFASRLHAYVTKMGYDAWMYRSNHTVGVPTWSEIAIEIRDRDIAIIIVTKGTRSSIGQQKELNIINYYDKPTYVLKEANATILPELSWANWSEFSEANFDEECEKAAMELPRTILSHKKLRQIANKYKRQRTTQ